jgi:predicted RNA-binding Zn-ribbon protein involved in translation (DUF1610 family)
MIYKCKKCKYTTEDLSRQVCPLCGNKIVQKTEESTDGFCNVYGVKINLKNELQTVLQQYEQDDTWFDYDNIIKHKIKNECKASKKKDRWSIKQYCKKYHTIPSTIPIEFYKKYDKKKKEEKEIQQRIELRKSQQLHCPNCQSTNIKRISTTSRVIGSMMLGILSSNIGKTYQCNKCKYKW